MTAKVDKLQSTDFLPYLNQSFRIGGEDMTPIDLELVRVTEVGEPHEPGSRTPFSLLFLGPVSNLYLRQHIYRLEHEALGSLEIFLVPLGPERGRMRYEAIFN